jgi:sugar (pentulose or hexulose) kinase
VCLGPDNEPVRDVILWVDDRTAPDLPPLSAPFRALLRLSGLEDKVDLQRRKSHCNWIARYEPEVWAKTRTFALISTWLNWKFTGNLLDSNASMIGHLPFDNKHRTWMKQSDFRRLIFAVQGDRLFDLVAPGTELGRITPQAAAATGIIVGLPLIATGSDKGCETLGLSCLESNKAALSFGTTATVQVSTRRYFDPTPNMPSYAAVVPGYYNPEAQIYRGYWLLSWFKKEFAAKEDAEAQKRGLCAEQLLDARLPEIPPGCDGLIFQPYFTPVFTMPHAKGAVIGFSDSHTRMHLYRAIIEGLNFALLQGLETLQKRGRLTTESLFVAGGGARSDEVCRITASQFGLPVYRTQTHEACGIGQALCAFVSRGVFASYEEGLAQMVHIKDEFLPNAADHARYRALYDGVFVKVFNKLSSLYKEINAIFHEKTKSP